jgi:hypothetical protein
MFDRSDNKTTCQSIIIRTFVFLRHAATNFLAQIKSFVSLCYKSHKFKIQVKLSHFKKCYCFFPFFPEVGRVSVSIGARVRSYEDTDRKSTIRLHAVVVVKRHTFTTSTFNLHSSMLMLLFTVRDQ